MSEEDSLKDYLNMDSEEPFTAKDMPHLKGWMALNLMKAGKGIRLYRDGILILSFRPECTPRGNNARFDPHTGYVVLSRDDVPEYASVWVYYYPEGRVLGVQIQILDGSGRHGIMSVGVDTIDAVMPAR